MYLRFIFHQGTFNQKFETGGWAVGLGTITFADNTPEENKVKFGLG